MANKNISISKIVPVLEKLLKDGKTVQEESFVYTRKWTRKDIEKWMQDGITEPLPLNGQQFNVRTFIAI